MASSAKGRDAEAICYLKDLVVKRITWLLIFAYTLLIFKPVMPVIMDVIAHTFWEQQHLLTVHEVNGKFHVHNELAKAAHQSEKDKQASGSKYAADGYLHVAQSEHPNIYRYYPGQDNFHSYNCFFPFFLRGTDNPPPWAFLCV